MTRLNLIQGIWLEEFIKLEIIAANIAFEMFEISFNRLLANLLQFHDALHIY